MAPRVSVLMPVRDSAQYVREAIESITTQTLGDLELIVVDDGSRDETAQLVAACAGDDSRVRFLRQEMAGIVFAIETARRLARAPLIARMDADDIALPRRLELQVARLEDSEIDACGGQVEFFPRAGVRDGMRRYETWLNSLTSPEDAARDVWVEYPIANPTLVVRRAALQAAGGWRANAWPEDYDLLLRLHRRGSRFVNVGTPVLRWRDHDRRITRRDARYSQAAFVRCKVHHLRAHLLRGVRRSVVIYGCGPVAKSYARELQRHGVLIDAFFEVDARKIGKRVYGVPVLAMDEHGRFPDSLALGGVAGLRARTEIRAAARAVGRRDGIDFVAVA